MKVVLVTPPKELFRGDAYSVSVPAHKGIMQILPNHAPLLAVLKKGPVVIKGDYGTERFDISSGFMEVHDDNVTLLVRNE